MSVMNCSRKGCNAIMCNRYSNVYGYICEECFQELIISGPETNIESFLNIEKYKKNKRASEARFNIEFPII